MTLNTVFQKGGTALMAACNKGHVEIVSALLAAHADANISDNVSA